jgi:hypothetical protein
MLRQIFQAAKVFQYYIPATGIDQVLLVHFRQNP